MEYSNHEKLEKGKQLSLTHTHKFFKVLRILSFLFNSVLWMSQFCLERPVRSYLKHVLYYEKTLEQWKIKL